MSEYEILGVVVGGLAVLFVLFLIITYNSLVSPD